MSNSYHGIWAGIVVDGISYDVRVRYESLQRTFKLVEGRHAGTSLRYKKIRDLQGTAYEYQFEVEPNPTNITGTYGYDAFYEAISAPVDSHSIEIIYGQTTKSFDAYIESGTDKFQGTHAGNNKFGALTVKFISIGPVRTS